MNRPLTVFTTTFLLHLLKVKFCAHKKGYFHFLGKYSQKIQNFLSGPSWPALILRSINRPKL